MVANFGGLARSLGRDVSELKDFALGFTQGKATFDFIDVGQDKDCASLKIKGKLSHAAPPEGGRDQLRRKMDIKNPAWLTCTCAENVRFHLENYNCRHILMGISHNPSYASFLNQAAQDEFCRQRMTIIEGIPTVPELVATGLPSLQLGKDLFRNDRQPDKNTSAWPLGAWVAGPRTASPATSIGSASTPGRSSLSYANAASSSPPPPQITLPIAPKPVASRPASKVQYQQVPPQQPDWNPGPRGLDEPITVCVSAMESIKKRKESDKLCNNHFLRGPCTKGDSCFFIHDYKPSNEEINAIAVLARQNPCTNGQDCESSECIYGHHVSVPCLSPVLSLVCTHTCTRAHFY